MDHDNNGNDDYDDNNNATAREHALIASSILLSNKTKLSIEFINYRHSLQSIASAIRSPVNNMRDSAISVSHEKSKNREISKSSSRIRFFALEALNNLISWLEQNRITEMIDELNLMECCLICLIEVKHLIVFALKKSIPYFLVIFL